MRSSRNLSSGMQHRPFTFRRPFVFVTVGVRRRINPKERGMYSKMDLRRRCSKILTPLFLVFVVFSSSALAQASAAEFKAGAARRDITPHEPLPMWGYGARHDALSVGTLDPLYAVALVIQAGDKKIAIVGLDLGRAPAERSLQNIRKRIKAEAGIEYSMIAGSHTHHGPVLELSNEDGKGKGRFDAALRYYVQMEDGIVAAILEA